MANVWEFLTSSSFRADLGKVKGTFDRKWSEVALPRVEGVEGFHIGQPIEPVSD